jgi:hypothetical protein
MKYTLTLMMLLSLNPDLTPTRTFVGIATDLNEGKSLYSEEHEDSYENGKRLRLTTKYRDESKNVIAARIVDFSQNPFMPDFRLENYRTGYIEGAEMVNNGLRVYVRKSADQPIREKILSVPKPSVVDAGFNNFVQTHWDSLMTGKKLYLNFAVPARLEYYGFRLYKEGETTVRGRRAVIVKCDVDNFMLRLFLDPIILTYDVESMRLISYEGISNISNDKGDNYFVRIAFSPLGP